MEVRVPAGVKHLGLCGFGPLAAALELQPSGPRLAGLEREELRGEFQHAVLVRVEREGDDLVARHIHRRRRRWRGGFGFVVLRGGGLRCAALRPPLPGRERFEVRKFLTERLRGFLRRERADFNRERAESGGGDFECGAAAGFHVRLDDAGKVVSRSQLFLPKIRSSESLVCQTSASG